MGTCRLDLIHGRGRSKKWPYAFAGSFYLETLVVLLLSHSVLVLALFGPAHELMLMCLNGCRHRV